MPGRAHGLLVLSDDERVVLTRWTRRQKSSQALAMRARIVLACADGTPHTHVAARPGVSRDIVGLYLDPPVGAMVLAVDEKSQMQALDRTAPVLPMMPTTPQRQTHDYVRHGTTSLFAALDMATGRVIGQTQRQHRLQEFLR